MNNFHDTIAIIDLRELASYRPSVDGSAPPAPIAPYAPPASATRLSMAEVVCIWQDRLRLAWANMRDFGVRAWAMGVTPQQAAERTITFELPVINTTPAPRLRWRDALLLSVIAAVVLMSLGMSMTAQATPATTRPAYVRFTPNPHPCALYHYPFQAPAKYHCAILKSPKKVKGK